MAQPIFRIAQLVRRSLSKAPAVLQLNHPPPLWSLTLWVHMTRLSMAGHFHGADIHIELGLGKMLGIAGERRLEI